MGKIALAFAFNVVHKCTTVCFKMAPASKTLKTLTSTTLNYIVSEHPYEDTLKT
jgi:hypothetical protein